MYLFLMRETEGVEEKGNEIQRNSSGAKSKFNISKADVGSSLSDWLWFALVFSSNSSLISCGDAVCNESKITMK